MSNTELSDDRIAVANGGAVNGEWSIRQMEAGAAEPPGQLEELDKAGKRVCAEDERATPSDEPRRRPRPIETEIGSESELRHSRRRGC